MFANLQRKNYHRKQCLMGVSRPGARSGAARRARSAHRAACASRHIRATPPNAKRVGVSPTQNRNLKKLSYLDMLRYVSDFYDIISGQRNWNIKIHRFNSTFFKNTSLHIENCISRA